MAGEGGFTDNETGAGLLGGGEQLFLVIGGESNDWQMAGRGVFPDFFDSGQHFAPRLEIHEQEHGLFAPGCRRQQRNVVDRQDTILQILQTVHQLTAGHQPFVKNQRERLRHGPRLTGKRTKGKKVFIILCSGAQIGRVPSLHEVHLLSAFLPLGRQRLC